MEIHVHGHLDRGRLSLRVGAFVQSVGLCEEALLFSFWPWMDSGAS